MSRTHIDFGIDLGTTNSEVAFMNENGDVEVIENMHQDKFTPSAVWENEDLELIVGKEALDALVNDEEARVVRRFKRKMGELDWSFELPRSKRKLSPPALSAEVLKSLLADAERRTGHRPRAAVITVPEAFTDPMKYATEEAAQLGGLEQFVLLQEPIAACYAYNTKLSPDRRGNRKYWLVYDLGGGTFDAALVWIEGGSFFLKDHEGDIYLGGTRIDESFTESFVLPKLKSDYAHIEVNNQIRELMYRAVELWKIKLSGTRSSTPLRISHRSVIPERNFTFVLAHCDERMLAAAMADPLHRSLLWVRRLLEKNNLASMDIDRVILVGGPTLSPVLRETLKGQYPWDEELVRFIPEAERSMALQNLREGLRSAQIDHTVDPITVVAQGAAIFAGGVPLGLHDDSLDKRKLRVAIVSPSDPGKEGAVYPRWVPREQTTARIAGVVWDYTGKRAVDEGWQVEIERQDGTWTSQRVVVGDGGRFRLEAELEPRKDPNKFKIKVYKPDGSEVPYLLGDTIAISYQAASERLDRDYGIGLAKYHQDVLFTQGTLIPPEGLCKCASDYMTTVSLDPSNPTAICAIPIHEDKAKYSLGNKLIGKVMIRAGDLDRPIPARSRVAIYMRVLPGSGGRISRVPADSGVEFSDQLPGKRFGIKFYGGTDVVPEQFMEICFKIDYLTAQTVFQDAFERLRRIEPFCRVEEEQFAEMRDRSLATPVGPSITTKHSLKDLRRVRDEYSQELRQLCDLANGRIERALSHLDRYQEVSGGDDLQQAESHCREIIRNFGGDHGSKERDFWKEAELAHLRVSTPFFMGEIEVLFRDFMAKVGRSAETRQEVIVQIIGELVRAESHGGDISIPGEEEMRRLVNTAESIIKDLDKQKSSYEELKKTLNRASSSQSEKSIVDFWEQAACIPVIGLVLFGKPLTIELQRLPG